MNMTSTEKDVAAERTEQLKRWTDANDDQWSMGEWAALIARYATRNCVGNLHKIDPKAFRQDMVKVAALAQAAIEAVDRKAVA